MNANFTESHERNAKSTPSKDSSLLYFRMFPSHRKITQKIPKRKKTEKHAENTPGHPGAIEKLPYDSVGSYEPVSKRRRYLKSGEKNPMNETYFDSSGEYNYRDKNVRWGRKKKVSSQADIQGEAPQNIFVRIPQVPPNRSLDSSPNRSHASNQNSRFLHSTLVQCREQVMTIENEKGKKQELRRNVRQIVNIKTSVEMSVRDIVPENIDKYLENIRHTTEKS